MTFSKQLLHSRIALVAVLLAFAMSSLAVAFVSAPGSGSATGTAATPLALTIAPAVAGPNLYPGGHGDVAITVDNPNPFSLHISSLSLATGQGTGGFDVDAAHADCSTSALSFATQTNGGAGWSLPPKVGSANGSLSIALPDALAMSLGAANACQGATFDVHLSAGL